MALTFDDGYEDNYTHAFPLLEKYGAPATFFLTAGLVERDRPIIERFRRLRQSTTDEIRPLAWSQILEMRSARFEFGGHTYSHVNLARLTDAEARAELTRSKDVLEERLGEAVRSMAYPFGKRGRHFTDDTVDLVESAGYEYAAAVHFRAVRSSDSKLELPRFFVTKDDPKTLAQKIRGSWDFLGWWQERSPLWVARLVSPSDFSQ